MLGLNAVRPYVGPSGPTGNLTDEAVEAMSPSAAAVSRLLRQGLTLTQIFTEFCQAKEQLTVAQAESRQLKLCLDQILKDIEDRTPAIQRQKEDYEVGHVGTGEDCSGRPVRTRGTGRQTREGHVT